MELDSKGIFETVKSNDINSRKDIFKEENAIG